MRSRDRQDLAGTRHRIEDRILLELNSVERLLPIHQEQVVISLRLTLPPHAGKAETATHIHKTHSRSANARPTSSTRLDISASSFTKMSPIAQPGAARIPCGLLRRWKTERAYEDQTNTPSQQDSHYAKASSSTADA